MGKRSGFKKNRQKSNIKVSGVQTRNILQTRHTLGLAMIMKDEIEDLDRIVYDYGAYFDKIYVTVTDKKTYTALQKSSVVSKVELSYFKWIDHFGKARQYNQRQVKTDYWMWIDLDDEIEGAEKLRQVVEYMDANSLDAVWFQYSYLRRINLSDPESIQWKVRVVRTASKLEWSDEAVHENIYMQSDINHKLISETDVMIKHRKTNDQLSTSAERNRSILEKDWQQNHRAITATYLGRDFMMSGDFERAIEKFLFVTEHSVNIALKFDAWENICEGYFQTGNYTAALAAANERMAIDPEHPGPWYQRFAAYGAMGNITEALQSAETAMSKRIQDVEGDIGILLNHNPSWYAYKALFNVARAYLSTGNNERAYELYQQVKKIAPEYIDEQSVATGVQLSAVFEKAHQDKLATD
jgi:tetratricopeptide (TPR) repeat protein